MITDIKKVIEALKADTKANATVVNDIRIKNVSVSASAAAAVDYWVTITFDRPVRGMYATKKDENGIGIEFAKGLTTTVMMPMGVIVTCLFDALFDIDDDTIVEVGKDASNNPVMKSVEDIALDICNAKDLLVKDFSTLATNKEHQSVVKRMLLKTSINVITRDVFAEDGKVKSLFSLNDTEREVVRDSVWYDVYGITKIRPSSMVEAYNFVMNHKANEANADTVNPMVEAIRKAFSNTGAAGVVNNALGQ